MTREQMKFRHRLVRIREWWVVLGHWILVSEVLGSVVMLEVFVNEGRSEVFEGAEDLGDLGFRDPLVQD